MKRKALALAVTGLGVAAMVWPALAGAADEQVVKIGLTSPLSGALAVTGKDHENGARMAIARLNPKGLVIAGKKVTFQLVPEDDQADPKSGVQVAQKLVDAGVKAVLGPYNSGVAMPASKVYNDANVVLAMVASNPKITQQGHNFSFRIGANDSQLGGTMAMYAAKEMKLRRVAVVDDRTAYGQGVAEEFIKMAKANGTEVIAREFTNDKAVDFNPIIVSIKAKKPDGVFYAGMYTQGAAMKRQMKQLSLNIPMLGGDGICSTEMGTLGGEAVDEGVYCTQGGSMLEAQTAGSQFSADFQKLYNRKPLIYAVSFYDGMMLIAEAMKKANSVEAKDFAPVMASMSYKGIAGQYEFDKYHDLKSSPVTVYQFKSGSPIPLQSY